MSVSPALLMRTDSPVMESVVANYVYASPGCDYALLPIALPAMLNHQPEDVANIEVRWMSHKTPNVSTKTSGVHSETSLPADEQSNAGNRLFDIHTSFVITYAHTIILTPKDAHIQ